MSNGVLKGIHRRALGLGHDNEVMAKDGFYSGGDGKPGFFHSSHDTVALFDDFLGDLVKDEWAYVETDTGYTGALTSATNGIFRVQSSSTATFVPANAAALTGGLFKNWKANQGGPKKGRLRFGARVKLASVSRTANRTHAFIGLADTGGAEMPIYDTGAGTISNAADYAGFMFSTGGDTGWSLVAGKSTAGDSGDQLSVAGSSYGPSTNTYTTLEMEIRSGNSDTGGRAHFWIDGKKVGAIDSPVNSATALTPWLGIFGQDTGNAILDIDYVAISAPRDTGE